MPAHDYRCIEAGCTGAVLGVYVQLSAGDKVPKWKKCPECGARMPQSYSGGLVSQKPGRTYPFWHPGFAMMVTGPGHLQQLCRRYKVIEAHDREGGASPIDLDRQAAEDDETRPSFEQEIAENFAEEIAAGYNPGWTDEGDHSKELDESTRPHMTPDEAVKKI